ncbi:MAG: hypothetical protein VB078_10500 [Clostridiaceae bacterium]|nr:hypothetical protein [Clostridiaceae bacterium]
MKKLLSLIFILLILPCAARAAVDTSKLIGAVPPEASEFVKITPESGDVKEGLSGIVSGFLNMLQKSLKSSFAEGFIILAISSLSAVVVLFVTPTSSDVLKKVIDITGICAVTALCISGASGVLESCAEAIRNLQYFSSALIPVYAIAVAVSGRPLSAVSTSSATLIFSNIMIMLSSKILIPAIYLHIILSAVGRIAENNVILGIAQMFKKASLSFFKYFLMLYTGYITLSGLISSGTDAVTLKTAKVTIAGSVPVLGSIVSDVSEAILSGAVVLKNAVGIYGFIGALAICLVPFAAVAARLLVFKFLALISSSLCGGNLSKLLENISESYSIALGLLGTCCAIQFLSFVISSVVIKT